MDGNDEIGPNQQSRFVFFPSSFMLINVFYFIFRNTLNLQDTRLVLLRLWAGFSAILVNKICKIMKIFEQLDHIKSRWVFYQH